MYAALFFFLLHGVTADWTTTIQATVTIPNGVTPVVAYATAPPSGSSTPSLIPATSSASSTFGALSHTETFSTVVTVSDGMVPVIHFTRTGSSLPGPSSSVTATSSRNPSTTSTFFDSSASATPSSRAITTKQSSASASKLSTVQISKSSSSYPVSSSTSPRSSTSSEHKSATSSLSLSRSETAPGSKSSSSSSLSSTSSARVSSTSTSASSSGVQLSSSSASSLVSSSESSLIPSSSRGLSSSVPSSSASQTSSSPLTGATAVPGIAALTPSGTASAQESALLHFGPTGSPAPQSWETLTSVPASTITGTPAKAEATNIAGFLLGFYNNADQLKTDPVAYKYNLEKAKKQSEEYLSQIGYKGTSPCAAGSFKKRSLVGDIGNLASSAANVAIGDTAAAVSLVGDAVSCVSPIVDGMTKTIPDDATKITSEIEGLIENESQYLTELGNIIDTLEQENDDSESSSTASTETSSSSCTSSTTYSDCSTTVSVISTYSTGLNGAATGTAITTTSSSCSTITACSGSASAAATTITSGSCLMPISVTVTATRTNAITTASYTGIVPTVPTASSGAISSSSARASSSSSSLISASSLSSSSAASSSSAVSTSTNNSSSSDGTTTTWSSTSSSPPSTTLATSTITSAPAYCHNYAAPHEDKAYCTCSSTSSGTLIYTSLSLMSNGGCGYKTYPQPSPTSSSPTTSSSPMVTSSARYCINYADPHEGKDYCTCSSYSSGSALYTSLPLMTDGGCSYNVFPTPTPAYPFTKTSDGTVIGYATSTISVMNVAGYKVTVTDGAGSSKVLQTPAPTGFPFTTTSDDTVIAYATSTLSVLNAAGYKITLTQGAGSATTISVPSPTAKCAMWDELEAFMFLIYDIDHWDVTDDDLQNSLKDEESGCGALTAWDYSTDTTHGTAAKFNLPLIFKSGCVERAIRSAGGPDTSSDSCSGHGIHVFKGSDSVQDIVNKL